MNAKSTQGVGGSLPGAKISRHERKVETCLKHHCVYPNMTAGATHVYMC